jgi:CRP/FNR family transcriptional regulator
MSASYHDIKHQIIAAGKTQRLPAGAVLFTMDDPCEHYVLVLEGQIRVELSSITGQQLMLYRIHQDQSCVLTTACLMSGNNYSAQAIAETDITIALVPAVVFSRMLGESAAFRQFVFDGFAERLTTMMQRTSELTTYSIDQRLAAALLARLNSTGDLTLTITHEELAVEIGTVREVVSRRLAAFERDGWLRRHRKQVEVIDAGALEDKLAL